MLVTKRNFQMQHFLPSALESKMARLDNAGMHGTNGDLMNLASVDAKELSVGGRIANGSAHGFEPRVAIRFEAVLFPNLPFKKVGLRMCSCERGITSFDGGASSHCERRIRVKGNDGNQMRAVAVRHAEPGAKARTARQLVRRDADKVWGRPFGHFGPGKTASIRQQSERR
jgi:hypothetical protein